MDHSYFCSDRFKTLSFFSELPENNAIAAHPAFWAAFIQMGDDRGLVIYPKTDLSNYLLPILGLLSACLAALLFWYYKKKQAQKEKE